MEHDELLAFLKTIPLFEGMTNADLELVSGVCEMSRFAEGDVLIEEGQTAPPLHILKEGRVRVILPESSGFTHVTRTGEVTLNELGPGECFGEYSLLDEMPASATVVAESAGAVLRINNKSMKNLLAVDDRLTKTLYRNMLVALVGRLKRRESAADRVVILW